MSRRNSRVPAQSLHRDLHACSVLVRPLSRVRCVPGGDVDVVVSPRIERDVLRDDKGPRRDVGYALGPRVVRVARHGTHGPSIVQGGVPVVDEGLEGHGVACRKRRVPGRRGDDPDRGDRIWGKIARLCFRVDDIDMTDVCAGIPGSVGCGEGYGIGTLVSEAIVARAQPGGERSPVVDPP